MVLTRGQCSDTSNCYNFAFTGLAEEPDFVLTENVIQQSGVLIISNIPGLQAEALLYDMYGRLVSRTGILPYTEASIPTGSLAHGVYILYYRDSKGNAQSMKVVRAAE